MNGPFVVMLIGAFVFWIFALICILGALEDWASEKRAERRR